MNALLLTGAPGVGKTTILRKVVANLPPMTLRGFLTDEIREDNERVGFVAITRDLFKSVEKKAI